MPDPRGQGASGAEVGQGSSPPPVACDPPQDRVDADPLGWSELEWQSWLSARTQPAFRARQLLKWIHGRGIDDYSQMTDMPARLRDELAAELPLRQLPVAEVQRASDGVAKYLFAVSGGHWIEAVLIPAAGRNTLCISSQAGCPLACVFCETGRQGFARNLSAAEIIGQLRAVLRHERGAGRDTDISNVVMMGMGEPLLNLPELEPALAIMCSDHGYGLARRRLTVSTAGLVPGIDALKPGPTLALSLHAPDDPLRSSLLPVNRKYPIAEVLAACRRYLQRLPDRRKLTIEYTLIAGVNDSRQQARELVRLLADLPCKVNLIPCNPVSGLDFRAPAEPVMDAFAGELAPSLPVTLRRPRGLEVNAACGQLAGRVRPRGRTRPAAESTPAIEVRHV